LIFHQKQKQANLKFKIEQNTLIILAYQSDLLEFFISKRLGAWQQAANKYYFKLLGKGATNPPHTLVVVKVGTYAEYDSAGFQLQKNRCKLNLIKTSPNLATLHKKRAA